MKTPFFLTLAAALASGAPFMNAHPVRVVHGHVRPVAIVVRRPLLSIHVGGVIHIRHGHGRLDVEVSPERAKVFVDGRYEGRGDKHLTLAAGTHRVKVVLGDGREAESEIVSVDAGRVTRVHLDL